jgi:phosphoglycerate kinase
MRKQTTRDIDVSGKRVLVRVDYNVPIGDDGQILDDLRIKATLPTICYLREHRAKVILCSHRGRPKGTPDPKYTLAPVAQRLSELLGVNVPLTLDCIGPDAENAVESMQPGDVVLLENVRFHAEEEKNDAAFAKQLASLADVYVNDAFGTAHRAHASTEGVARLLPAVAGLLMEKEIEYLARVVARPEKPLGAIIGGAKISDKMAVLRNLLSKADVLVIGGGMANTFLKAQGNAVGDSLVEDDQLDTARAVLAEAKQRDVALLLPVDAVIADAFAADANARTVDANAVPGGWRIMDAGPRSIDAYAKALAPCKTVVWNGPLGVMEFPAFAKGSEALARALAEMDATTIVGGGETAAMIEEAGLAAKFDHVSTGGGAFLEFLEGRELPGVAALMDK